ncbi:F-BAR domain only protein 2 [Halotydeus destructor]|nr:F-BAR domain only protein 2 [Halotydeus destructor]
MSSQKGWSRFFKNRDKGGTGAEVSRQSSSDDSPERTSPPEHPVGSPWDTNGPTSTRAQLEDSDSSWDDDSDEDEKKVWKDLVIKPADGNLRRETSFRPIMPIARPPSKLTMGNSMARAKSYGSLSSTDFRMTPLSISSSRESSPLTRAPSDTIPIAVAFQECISARFKGTDETRCQSQINGSVKFAFPSSIVQALSNNAPAILCFKLNNATKIQKIIPNKDLVSITDGQLGSESLSFAVNVESLGSHLQKLLVQSPHAKYYNVDIIKYQLKNLGVKGCPLHVVSHWKCEPTWTFLKIEYKYNPSAVSSFQAIKNADFSVNIDAYVNSVQGKPNPFWNVSNRQACWKFDTLALSSDDNGLGSLRAKFEVINGPSRPTPVVVQFTCNDATLSGLEFEMTSGGYRVATVKKIISSGRYSSEADASIRYACI